MVKVFLVEDESIIRRGIRDNIAWESHGFEFVGEAGDGEYAYPLLLNTKTGYSDHRYKDAVYGRTGIKPPGEKKSA